MKQFNFRKTVMRNDFTAIFGGAGRRRTVHAPRLIYRPWGIFNVVGKQPPSKRLVRRFKLAKIRRAHQGWRNRTFGSINALKIRLQYGRRAPAKQFRR